MVKIPSSNTVPHVSVIDGQLTTTSRDIADCFGKRHDDVLKRIRSLDCTPEFRHRNFAEASYQVAGGQGATGTHTEYRITRDGFSFLCMGFTGAKAAQWKERYISTFNQMAEQLVNPVPSLQFRRWLVSYDDGGKEVVQSVPMSSAILNPDDADDVAAFLLEMVPQRLLTEALATLTGRISRVLHQTISERQAKRLAQ